jgi:nicotinamidase-related amidase
MKNIFFTLMLLASISLSAQEKAPERLRPALLVIDIQNQFLPWMDEDGKALAMLAINAYIDGFRELGFPIVRIYHSDKTTGPFPGTPEFEFPEDVHILPDDPKIIKTYGDGFNKTDLEKVLRDLHVNTVFLCGLSATGCVLSTYIGAHNHDFKAFLLKYALLSHDSQYTDQIETIFDALGSDAVEVMLDNAEKAK